MSLSNENKKAFRAKLYDRFRLVIIDDDTLKEIKSTRFILINLIIGIVVSILLIMAISFSIIAYTPVRFLVPGYGDITNNRVYMELSQKIETLEKDINAQRVYTEGFKNFLNPSGTKIENLSSDGENNELFSNDLPNNKMSSKSFSLEHYYFCSPLKGEVSAEFNLDKGHYGIDIVAPKNSAILNILDGVVINSDWSDKTGHTISIQHSGNLISIFKHNSVLLKRTGERVKKGEAIAIIGNTGELTSGPHVHFELWNDGIALNPLNYLSFNQNNE